MRKIIVGAFVSLDGIMQAPGGPEEDPIGGFRFGGWVAPFFDEKMGESVGETFSRPFDLLLGRKTYDIFAAHWPYAGADDPIGPLFDRINKYVATRNPAFAPTWQNSHVLGSDTIAAVRALKAGEGPDLLTQGSTEFLKALFENDLVDEIHVSIFPVILGKGKRGRLLPARADADLLEDQRHGRDDEPICPRQRSRHRLLRVRHPDRRRAGTPPQPHLTVRQAPPPPPSRPARRRRRTWRG